MNTLTVRGDEREEREGGGAGGVVGGPGPLLFPLSRLWLPRRVDFMNPAHEPGARDLAAGFGAKPKETAMKKLLVVGVFLNAALLFAIWHEVSAAAQGGGAGPVASTNGDVNGSGAIDISDASYLLNWLFLGGPAPVAIAQADGLTAEELALLKAIVPHLSIEQLPTLTNEFLLQNAPAR